MTIQYERLMNKKFCSSGNKKQQSGDREEVPDASKVDDVQVATNTEFGDKEEIDNTEEESSNDDKIGDYTTVQRPR